SSLGFVAQRASELGEVFKFLGNKDASRLLNMMVQSEPMEPMKDFERLELNAFAVQSQVYSDAAKFAVQDGLRERYVIQMLKNGVSRFKGDRLLSDTFDELLNSSDGDYSP